MRPPWAGDEPVSGLPSPPDSIRECLAEEPARGGGGGDGGGGIQGGGDPGGSLLRHDARCIGGDTSAKRRHSPTLTTWSELRGGR